MITGLVTALLLNCFFNLIYSIMLIKSKIYKFSHVAENYKNKSFCYFGISRFNVKYELLINDLLLMIF